ncbi:MAG: DNA polymerase III subunit alpha [Caldilineaceae bacterium]|nr:DNA polymerase III subunit alpha [Caldilineaceae bacterium]
MRWLDVYFLIVADLCDFARSRNIWWNVRGSGAGSLVAYCTGITGLDPLKNNLIFERFLNPGRVTMPDFDLDYPDDQREELIRYTIEKYGEEQVAQIATFGRMKARAAIRDVGRAQDIALHEVDRIAKLIPAIPGKPVTIQDVLTEGNEFYNPELADLAGKQEWVRGLLDTSMQLEGVARHSGIHAAAVIVADRELTHYTPLMRGSKGSITNAVAQYEFPILESIGLLKVDFLGLSTLSVMREAVRLIRERHGIEYTLGNIPFEGEAASEAFKLLSSGEVSGVFQVESQGMRRVLTEMRPSAFEHIIATISLYRPGPIEYIPQFIRRMHGDEPVEYKHPALESILAETYGIIVYQEQIIQALSQLAGYTPGEADLVRRAISKKKASDIEYHKKLFVEGCQKKGIPKQAATDIYGDIEFFARYGFNKSHAADYAVITVQTAYLKARYPVEYMAALLLIERDKTEKVVNFINESRRMGIDVLPPDVNYSGLDFEIQELPADVESAAQRDALIAYPFPVPEGSAIRFGMAAIKNVGEGPVRVIIEARASDGPFQNLEDFCDSVDLRQVNKRALECLVKVGALDRFGYRSRLLTALDQLIARSAATHSAKESGQLSMFDLMGGGAVEVVPIRLPDIEEASGRERLQWEKELLGVYTMSHPLQHVSIDLKKIVTCACNELDASYDGKNVLLAGMIESVRTITTKKGDLMAFVQLEDFQGQCEVVVFPRTYGDFKDKLIEDNVVVVKGKAQTREGQTTLLADSIQNYVEQAVAMADEWGKQQPPLLVVSPTINGVAIQEEDGDYDETPLSDYLGDGPEDEESPFANDPPAWAADAGQVSSEKRIPEELSRENGSQNGESKPVAPEPILAPSAAPLASVGVGAVETATNGKSPVIETIAPEVTQEESELSDVSGQPPSADERPAEFQPVGKSTNGHAAKSAEPTTAPAATVSPVAERVGTPAHSGSKRLYITFRRSGDLARDKYRLKEIYDRVRDPRGRDRFFILLESKGKRLELSFPNDLCTISPRLTDELTKHFRVEIEIDEQSHST